MIRLKSVVLWLFDKNTCSFMKFTQKKTSIHINWTEVCGPSAGKFHDAPDNQIQDRKRDHPESPEPSPADTLKRLRVNGRIALNRVMDRRTLSSQPISREGLVDIQVSGPTVLTRSKCCSWQHFRWWMCMFCMQRRVPNGVICGAPYHLF